MSDLIDRQAAIAMCRKPRMRNADCSDFEMEIMMLPSAQPERTGKWLPEYGDPSASAHYCSACNFYYTTCPEEMNYCPHCGAKMEV